MSFERMKAYINATGGSIRKSKILDGRKVRRSVFNEDVAYREQFCLWAFGKRSDELANVPVQLFNEKHSAAQGFTVEFNCLIDECYPVVGDVLYDKENDVYWICWESYDRDGIQRSGVLKRATVMLKWQDENGNICEYPAFDDNSTQYNSGVTRDYDFLQGASQHNLWLPADENTIAIDHDMRMFLDRNVKAPTVFKVTQNDTTSFNYDKGVIKITLAEDEFKPEFDSIEKWICDYKPPKIVYDIDIQCDGGNKVRIGETKMFTATDENAVFSLEMSEKLSKYVKLKDIGGGKCSITVEFFQRIAGEKFTLKAENGGKYGLVDITITGGV